MYMYTAVSVSQYDVAEPTMTTQEFQIQAERNGKLCGQSVHIEKCPTKIMKSFDKQCFEVTEESNFFVHIMALVKGA